MEEEKDKKWTTDFIVDISVWSIFFSCITGAIAASIGFNVPAAVILTVIFVFAWAAVS